MKKLCIGLIMIAVLSIPVLATDSVVSDTTEDLFSDALEGQQQMEEELGFSLDHILSMSPGDYLEAIVDGIAQQISQPLQLFAVVLVVLLMSSVARALVPQMGITTPGTTATLDSVINVVFFLVLLAPVLSMQSVLSEAITDCKDFLDSFLMVFISLIATGGQVGTAAVATGFFAGSIFLVSELLTEIVLPIAGVYLSLKSCSLCVNSVEFGGVAEVIRKTSRYILLGTATLFTAVMSMQSLIASAADNVAIRTGKFIVGNGVPIIGSAIQDAITTVMGGIGAVKTTAGMTAIVSVILMFAPMLIRCVAYLLLFVLASVTAEIAGSQKVSELMKAAAYTMEIYFSGIVMFCLMIILSLLTFMLSGGLVN